jgi:hypothetical protein
VYVVLCRLFYMKTYISDVKNNLFDVLGLTDKFKTQSKLLVLIDL